MLVILEITKLLVSIKKTFCIRVNHLIQGASVQTGCYIYNSLFHIIYVLIILCNRGLFKSYYFYALFLLFEKFFIFYEKCFLIPSLYILGRKIFINKYKKHMCYKENKILLQKPIKFRYKDSIRFGIFQVA